MEHYTQGTKQLIAFSSERWAAKRDLVRWDRQKTALLASELQHKILKQLLHVMVSR